MISERVLCVDDDAAARKLLMRLGAAAGHEEVPHVFDAPTSRGRSAA